MDTNPPYDIRPITPEEPLRDHEVELTEEDAKYAETLTEEQKAEFLDDIRARRIRAMEELETGPEAREEEMTEGAEKMYKAMFNALFPDPDAKTPDELRIARAKKAKRRQQKKAAKKSRQRNRR